MKKMPFDRMPKMTAKEVIREDLIARWNPQAQVEAVSLDQALDRVLASDLFAEVELPVYRCSAMDGVAVKSAMFENGLPDPSAWVLGEDFVRADTGDDFPDAYDAVIRIEDVTLDETQEHIVSFDPDISVRKGLGVRANGVFVKKGELLVRKGTWLTPSDLTSIAVGGISQVPVYKKPIVAFIPTGSELVPAGTVPQRGQMIDCNSILMKYSLQKLGADVRMHPIVKDDRELLKAEYQSAVEEGADIIILNGGSSKGSEDYNVQLLGEFGQVLYHEASVVPGRPIAVSDAGRHIGIVQPGPAVGCFNVLQWLLRPLIAYYYGIAVPKGETVMAKLTEDLKGPKPMDMLIKLHLTVDQDGVYYATPLPGRMSTIPQSFETEGWFHHPKGTDFIPKGAEIEVNLLRDKAFIPETDLVEE